MFGSPKCPDIIYVVFFRNRISASICLTFTQFSIVSPLWRLPQIWFDVGWQWKKRFWADKKNNGCMEKGWKFLWDWIRIYILQGFMSLGNTAQLGWLQKMSVISPLPKKKQGISEQTLYFCSHALLCEFVGRLLNVTRVTRPTFRKKNVYGVKTIKNNGSVVGPRTLSTQPKCLLENVQQKRIFHISSSLKACQSHLELYHWCWSWHCRNVLFQVHTLGPQNTNAPYPLQNKPITFTNDKAYPPGYSSHHSWWLMQITPNFNQLKSFDWRLNIISFAWVTLFLTNRMFATCVALNVSNPCSNRELQNRTINQRSHNFDRTTPTN